MDASHFNASLAEIRWFSAIGSAPIANRITQWDDWLGPEDLDVEAMSADHQELFDSFCDSSHELPSGLQEVWDDVFGRVLNAAKVAVPYREDADAWHPPTAATWQAAWTAGLVALHLRTERQIPDTILEQWRWFTVGHWPCSYVEFESEPRQLIVY